MPLLSGKSSAIIGKNIRELVHTKPGKTRKKGMMTMARNMHITPERAKIMQAVAIARSNANKY